MLQSPKRHVMLLVELSVVIVWLLVSSGGSVWIWMWSGWFGVSFAGELVVGSLGVSLGGAGVVVGSGMCGPRVLAGGV